MGVVRRSSIEIGHRSSRSKRLASGSAPGKIHSARMVGESAFLAWRWWRETVSGGVRCARRFRPVVALGRRNWRLRSAHRRAGHKNFHNRLLAFSLTRRTDRRGRSILTVGVYLLPLRFRFGLQVPEGDTRLLRFAGLLLSRWGCSDGGHFQRLQALRVSTPGRASRGTGGGIVVNEIVLRLIL